MELPTARELELETLLRAKDKQLAELHDEVTHLRRSLTTQPGPSTSDPVTLPPALVSVLLPHIHAAASSTKTAVASTSNTVTAALTQRARSLQEENDELYDLLKFGETGKLKEEVSGLRRVVDRLQGTLRESHQVITTLSTELEKTYENLAAQTSSNSVSNSNKSYTRSPRAPYHHPVPPHSMDNGTKLPPTGPRAHKRPRLEPQVSPPLRTNVPLPHHKGHNHSHYSNRDARDYPPRRQSEGKGRHSHAVRSDANMEVEDGVRGRVPSPVYEREKDRDRDRDREKGRNRGTAGKEREGDRDGHRSHRRNGNFGSGGANRGGSGRRVERHSNESTSGDRTLAERMGL